MHIGPGVLWYIVCLVFRVSQSRHRSVRLPCELPPQVYKDKKHMEPNVIKADEGLQAMWC